MPVLLAMALLLGCTATDAPVTLWKEDHRAYGTWYAYTQLSHLFPKARVITEGSPYLLNDLDDGPAAYIFIGSVFHPTDEELSALLDFLAAGHYLFVSAPDPDESLLRAFGLETAPPEIAAFRVDSLKVSLRSGSFFAYPGWSMDNHFERFDSSRATVLGTDGAGRANYLRLDLRGGGAVFFHLAPLAFTNYFLLHRENKAYYDQAFSELPADIRTLIWDDYFRYRKTRGDPGDAPPAFSKLDAILRDEVLRWPFWLMILLFVSLYLFESKRKQRQIPVLQQPRNASVDFVKIIGRLYFQQGDHSNLARKIASHFLIQVRSRYPLPSGKPGDAFGKRLAQLSGTPLPLVEAILADIRRAEEREPFSDLMEFHRRIEAFQNQVRTNQPSYGTT